MIEYVLPPLLGGVVAYLVTPSVIRLGRALGLVRVDVHKPYKHEVPNSGGLAIALSLAVSLAALAALRPGWIPQILVFAGAVFLSFAVGLVDDFKVLPGPLKTALTVVAAAPIFLGALVKPPVLVLGRPRVPVLGVLRLTVIYWLLLPLVVAGPANAVNMLDIMNGIMPATTLLAFVALAASSALLGSELGLALSLVMAGVLAGYIPYNAYPARVFNGDSGSLSVGAAIGALAVLTRLEFVAMVALFPHILNAFLVVSSIRGLKEHRKLPFRPLVVHRDGTLSANTNPRALTLSPSVGPIGPLDRRPRPPAPRRP